MEEPSNQRTAVRQLYTQKTGVRVGGKNADGGHTGASSLLDSSSDENDEVHNHPPIPEAKRPLFGSDDSDSDDDEGGCDIGEFTALLREQKKERTRQEQLQALRARYQASQPVESSPVVGSSAVADDVNVCVALMNEDDDFGSCDDDESKSFFQNQSDECEGDGEISDDEDVDAEMEEALDEKLLESFGGMEKLMRGHETFVERLRGLTWESICEQSLNAKGKVDYSTVYKDPEDNHILTFHTIHPGRVKSCSTCGMIH